MKRIKKQTFNILGWIAFSLGFIGAFLPMLPTTPFMLLAAYFFSKGSPRFYDWLINLKYFGKHIRDWREYGVIDLKSKILATILLLSVLAAYHLYTDMSLWIKGSIATIFLCILIFINTRPSKKRIRKMV